jgi:putative heme-binding domain-containing protein
MMIYSIKLNSRSPFFMKPFLVSALCCWFGMNLAFGQSADGIKIANLQGADLELMDNHDPASELENFDLLPGYEINLFAADPMLANPIHMVWDSRGRLWVACSWSYPQIKPGDVANDKIIILEDTDNDGKADKSTVFADGLYLPTGIELANGGCYVGQSPDILFLKDTNGDDVADVRELALTGFGIEDNHHSISAWRRGPGGWIYFQEGIFLHAQVETQHGLVRNFNGGVYQFNPRTQELKVFCKGTGGNPWGHVFDKWGQSFMVNNPRIMYLSPGTGAFKENTRIPPLITTEKQCGGDLASGTHLPDNIQGQLLTCRFKSRSIVRYEFIEDGAGYSANVLEPLLTSKHPNFRPVDCKIGPDGAIYVADWYNSIINHAQHDFRDPRRDHEHGRIWRISYKGRPLVEKPKLTGLSVDSLVSQLSSPEAWTRHQVRKELSEQDPDTVLIAVEKWIDSLDSRAPDYDLYLVEAMWACQNAERVSEKILRRVLNAKSGHARSAGARVIRYWFDQLNDPVSMLSKLADDPFPRARMEAVLSAGYIPKAEALPAALNGLNHDRDRFMAEAITSTVTALEPYWVSKFEAGELVFNKPEHQAFAEQFAGIGLDKRLVALLKAENPPTTEVQEVQKQFATTPNAKLVRLLVNAVGAGAVSSDAVAVAMLRGLETVGTQGKLKPGRYFSGLTSALSNSNDNIAAGVASSLGAWQYREAGDALLDTLRDSQRAPGVRSAAAVALAKLAQTKYTSALMSLAKDGDMETRYLAVNGLTVADMEIATVEVAHILAEDPGRADPIPLVNSFTKIRRGDSILADALQGVNVHPRVIAAITTYHQRTGQIPKRLQAVFVRSEEHSLSARLLEEDQSALVADVDSMGDPFRGEMIFRRSEMACMSCHGIGSVGPTLGPNLVAVGTAASTSYMVESILEPNASIAEHYENMLFTMQDGTIHMGVISFQNEQEVIIQDSSQGGVEVKIPVAGITSRTLMPSLMPANLADQLKSRSEFLDLAKFLSVLGQPGAFANDESPVIRRWQIAKATADSYPGSDGMWTTAYSKVDGILPATDITIGDRVIVRGYVEVQSPGEVILQLNDTNGLKIYLDDREVENPDTAIQLETGRRALSFWIDRKVRGNKGLRVELVTPSGSYAKYKPVGGI